MQILAPWTTILIFALMGLITEPLKAEHLPPGCKIIPFEILDENDDAKHPPENGRTWQQLFLESREPQSLLEASMLGFKIGILVGLPIATASTYAATRNLRTVAKVGIWAVVAGPLFVNLCYLAGCILNSFDLYHGLDPKIGISHPYVMICDSVELDFG